MSIRTIGNNYNAEKFDNLIHKSALELVRSTMGDDADTEKGKIFIVQASQNLKAKFKELPISFYQALEAYTEGKKAEDYLKLVDESQDDKLLNPSSFIELVLACSDSKLDVINKESAENYFNELFPQTKKQLTSKLETIDEVKSNTKSNYDPLLAEKIEDFFFKKAKSAFEKKSDKLSRLIDKAERTHDVDSLQKLKLEAQLNELKFEKQKTKLVHSAQKRLDKGKVTKEHFDSRLSQITPKEKSNDIRVRPPITENESISKVQIDFKERNIHINSFSDQSRKVRENEFVRDEIDTPEAEIE